MVCGGIFGGECHHGRGGLVGAGAVAELGFIGAAAVKPIAHPGQAGLYGRVPMRYLGLHQAQSDHRGLTGGARNVLLEKVDTRDHGRLLLGMGRCRGK